MSHQIIKVMKTTTHPSCSDHSTSISSYGVWGAMAEIYSTFIILLFELFVISNTSICKLFKFVLSLSLTLLNSLSLLNSEKKKYKLKCLISPKNIYIYIKKKLPPNLGPSLVRGP